MLTIQLHTIARHDLRGIKLEVAIGKGGIQGGIILLERTIKQCYAWDWAGREDGQEVYKESHKEIWGLSLWRNWLG